MRGDVLDEDVQVKKDFEPEPEPEEEAQNEDNEDVVSPQPASEPARAPSFGQSSLSDFDSKLKALTEMGWTDRRSNITALRPI